MFKWLARAGRSEKPEASVSRDPVADAVLSVDTLGRLPGDLLEGVPEPAPEYVEQATEPAPEAWQHEREARAEQEQEDS